MGAAAEDRVEASERLCQRRHGVVELAIEACHHRSARGIAVVFDQA
ncbi:MAG: hypothetical protein NVV60_06880 [Luteimonas sp.]|nr:hypothetical protein [Luteimonas sp.]